MFESLSGIEVSSLDTVLELGGGYGCMRRAMGNLGFNGRYTIFDLPVLLALQEFYTSSTSGRKTEFIDSVVGFIPDGKSLCVGMWSLSEMPLGVRAELERVLSAFDFTFLAYQRGINRVAKRLFFRSLEFNCSRTSLSPSNRYSLPYSYRPKSYTCLVLSVL